jgi:hypothetical protein
MLEDEDAWCLPFQQGVTAAAARFDCHLLSASPLNWARPMCGIDAIISPMATAFIQSQVVGGDSLPTIELGCV